MKSYENVEMARTRKDTKCIRTFWKSQNYSLQNSTFKM